MWTLPPSRGEVCIFTPSNLVGPCYISDWQNISERKYVSLNELFNWYEKLLLYAYWKIYSYMVSFSISNYHNVKIQSHRRPCIDTLVDNPNVNVPDSQQLPTMCMSHHVCSSQLSLRISTAPADIWPHERPQKSPNWIQSTHRPIRDNNSFFKALIGVSVLQQQITIIIYNFKYEVGWLFHFYLNLYNFFEV